MYQLSVEETRTILTLPPRHVLTRLTGWICDLCVLTGAAIFGVCMLAGIYPVLDGANHFQPAYTLGSLVALALAFLNGSAVRLQRAGWLLAVNVFLLCAPVIRLPSLATATVTATAATQRLKVMTFNAYWYHQDPDRIVDYILAEQPDIVLLQETGRRHITAFNTRLSEAFPYRRFCNDFDGCDGSVLSKRPWLEIKHTLRSEVAPPGIAVTFDLGTGQRLRVFGVHMWNPNAPNRQLREIAWLGEELGRVEGLKIVAGDFNLTPWTFALNRFERQARLVRHDGIRGTWPANRRVMPALFPIDHMFASPEIKLVSIERGPWLGSDHLPLIATFALP